MSDVTISVGQTGAESTAAAIGKVGDSAKHVGTGTESMGKTMAETLHNAHRLEGGMNQLERALGETTSGAHLMGGGLRVMTQAFRALMMDGPQLLLTGAIIALGMALNAIMGHFEDLKKKNEDAKKASEEHAKAIGELDHMRFTELIKQYDDVQKSADAAADAAERLQSAQIKLLSAQEKQKIAGIEARTNAAIAALPQDENYDQNKQALESKKARDVSDVQVQYANKQADMELAEAKRKESKVLTDISMSDGKRLEIQNKLDEDVAARQKLMQAHMAETPEKQKEYANEYAALKSGLEKNIEDEEAQLKTQYSTEKKIANEANVAGVNVQSADTTRSATQLSGISAGMGFAAEDYHTIAKDTPAVTLMANGDASQQQFYNNFAQFITATNTRFEKLNELLKQQAVSQQ